MASDEMRPGTDGWTDGRMDRRADELSKLLFLQMQDGRTDGLQRLSEWFLLQMHGTGQTD